MFREVTTMSIGTVKARVDQNMKGTRLDQPHAGRDVERSIVELVHARMCVQARL